MSPKFAIITCSLDGRDLQRTVDSIISQSFRDFEVVIVAPQDNHAAFKFSKKLKESVRSTLVNDPRYGVYGAMNAGAEVANGEYLIFLNEGDEFNSHKSLELLNNASKKRDWAYGAYIKRSRTFQQDAVYKFNPYSIFLHRFGWKYVPHPASIISRKLFEDLRGFDASETIAADQKLFLKAAQISKPGVTDEVISIFYLGGSSSRSTLEAMKDSKRISNEIFGYMFRNRIMDSILWKLNVVTKRCLKLLMP
jgi:glycosyltransferase involved in cell wall biosynthesis